MKHIAKQIVAMGVLVAGSTIVAASDRLEDGRRAYDAACADCHDTGKEGAPKTRQAGDWENRSHLWDAVLFEHAEKGYLAMPAKGGAEMATPYDVEAAAEYMVTITHPDLPHD